jgi:arabinose-5-phosphate isomerase
MKMAALRMVSHQEMNDQALLESGKAVLRTEGKALDALAQTLDQAFTRAVRLMVACKGRVVVSGMGKSGHVGRKIASTLASTGTPAIFVHPGEASHGDLGMIMGDDVVLAISNSGETSELSDLIAYTRRFSIPLIGITRHANSSLAQAADILLTLAPLPEVGALGLAPTTSTTMTLALGDALAVAALEDKGFTADDFHDFHPGGKLGKRLLRLRELMHTGDALPLAYENDSMETVLGVMTSKGFGCAGIVDAEGRLVGIITDGDLRRHFKTGLADKSAGDVMTRNPMTASPSLLAVEAVKRLNDNKRTQLFLVDEDHKLAGLIHIHDLLRAGLF